MSQLRAIFSVEWIKSVYSQTSGGSGATFGWKTLHHNLQQWFPVHHLTGLALGFLCCDPGMNALVTLGLGAPKVKKLPRGKKIIDDAKCQTGGIHTVNLVARLLTAGVLREIEIPTGVGTRSNDLRVSLNGFTADLEVKTLVSATAARRLQSELREKQSHLLPEPPFPVIVCAIPLETGTSDEDHKDPSRMKTKAESAPTKQLEHLDESFLEEFDRISALAILSPYVDHTGGLVKWTIDRVLLNPKAKTPILESVVLACLPLDGPPGSPPNFSLNRLLSIKC